MRFSISALAATLLVGVASAAGTTPQTILNDLSKTNNDLITLNKTLNTLKPGSALNTFIALQIQTQVDQISKDLNQSTKDANNIVGQFSDDDTLNIATAVGNLEPPITSVLGNIVTKKPIFAKAIFNFGDLSKTVRADLVQQRAEIGLFGNALAPHAASDYAGVAPQLTAEVQGLFDSAIAAYDKCSGAPGSVCLPPINF